MKRMPGLIMAFLLAARLCCPAQAIGTSAACAILMDGESGRILYEQNIHQPRLIASITKLMTALVAVEQGGPLDEEIVIRGAWLGSEGSSIYLQAGERITLRGLLYGLLLQSGNDAAMAIACHVSGDMEGFVALMNEKAADLGMKHTSFANPSGLNDDNHYSTAYDMALLAQACLENETVAEICATQSATVGKRTFFNHNKLLHRYEGCIGMKTGYTERAGRTLVSAARRDGQTLICVTLNDGNDWADHMALLDYGFESFPSSVLCQQGERFGMIPVRDSLIPAVGAAAAFTLRFPLAAGETLEKEVKMVDAIQAPTAGSVQVGSVAWSLNGTVVAEVPLVCDGIAKRDVQAPLTFWQRMGRILGWAKDAFGPGAELI